MPNWAECRLWVDGPADDVSNFFGKLIVEDEDGELMLDYGILVPLNEEGTWDYALANQLWGTKWQGSNVNQSGDNCVYFNSPWSGPDEYVRTVSEMYPNLLFELTCVEPGCDFSYKIHFQDGCDYPVGSGTFTWYCEEFGYEICDKCDYVLGWSGDCEFCNEQEQDEVEEEATV